MKPKRITEAFNRKVKYVDKLGKQRDVDWITKGKPKPEAKPQPPAQPPQESLAQQIVSTLLEADWHSDSEKQALQKPASATPAHMRPDVQKVLNKAERNVERLRKRGWTQRDFAHGLKQFMGGQKVFRKSKTQ